MRPRDVRVELTATALPTPRSTALPIPSPDMPIGSIMRSVEDGRAAGSVGDVVAQLHRQHHASLCRLATVLLGDADRAEEVVQEAFLRTYRSWWRIRDHDRAVGYLRTTVVNLCRSQLRRRTVERRANRATWHDEDHRVDEASAPGSMGVPDQAEAVVGIRRALADLPPRQREIVAAYYFEDMSVAAIATSMGCAVGTVKSQLAKARQHLRQVLGEVPEDDLDATRPGDRGVRPGGGRGVGSGDDRGVGSGGGHDEVPGD
jgi:RNA polymerase sigma-70 factor (sigma-E family)